jgi:hypothetical protein
MPNEHDLPGTRKLIGMYRGCVTDNLDPFKLGRCRITIPGLLPPEGGAWAFPIGGMGSGSPQRGQYDVPPIGSDVVVWFEQGDPDHPYYMGGNFGDDEVPPEVSDPDNDEEQATKVAVWETERWRVKLDGRFGKSEFHIIDKVTNDVIEIDGVAAGIRIKSTGPLQITSVTAIALNAPSITINGRQLINNGKPVQ